MSERRERMRAAEDRRAMYQRLTRERKRAMEAAEQRELEEVRRQQADLKRDFLARQAARQDRPGLAA